jgi:hypothetical protein
VCTVEKDPLESSHTPSCDVSDNLSNQVQEPRRREILDHDEVERATRASCLEKKSSSQPRIAEASASRRVSPDKAHHKVRCQSSVSPKYKRPALIKKDRRWNNEEGHSFRPPAQRQKRKEWDVSRSPDRQTNSQARSANSIEKVRTKAKERTCIAPEP